MGPYTMEYRKKVLSRIQELQEEIGDTLLTPEEESRIHQIWAEEQAELAHLLEADMEAGE